VRKGSLGCEYGGEGARPLAIAKLLAVALLSFMIRSYEASHLALQSW